jgi:hypothetical protein
MCLTRVPIRWRTTTVSNRFNRWSGAEFAANLRDGGDELGQPAPLLGYHRMSYPS